MVTRSVRGELQSLGSIHRVKSGWLVKNLNRGDFLTDSLKDAKESFKLPDEIVRPFRAVKDKWKRYTKWEMIGRGMLGW